MVFTLLSGDSLDIIILRFRMYIAMFCLVFLFVLSFREKALLYNPGWPRTHNPSASDFQMLALQECVTMSSSQVITEEQPPLYG